MQLISSNKSNNITDAGQQAREKNNYPFMCYLFTQNTKYIVISLERSGYFEVKSSKPTRPVHLNDPSALLKLLFKARYLVNWQVLAGQHRVPISPTL